MGHFKMMNKKQIIFLLQTAWRETISNLRDFRVMIMSLFLGIFVISLIFNITGALENGLRQNGKSILGGDILIRQIYEPISSEQLSFLNEEGQVSTSIEMRGLIYNPTQEQTGLSEIKAVDESYPLFGKVELQNNGVTDNIHQYLKSEKGKAPFIVMDASLVERLNLKIGDSVRLGNAPFILKDIVTHEPDRAGGSTFAVGPRSMMRVDAVETTGLLVEGAQTYYKYRVALNSPENIEILENTLDEMYPEAGWRLLKYTNASPRIQEFLEQLSLFFTLVGLSALLIGGVGIGNSTKVVLEKRISSIAVMKTVGASSAFVFSLWMTVLTLTAFIGIIPAILLAQILPFIIFEWVGQLLPVPAVPTISLVDIIQTIFLGFSILFIFSILTLSVASKVKPIVLLKQNMAAGMQGIAGKKAIIAFGFVLLLSVFVIVATSPRPIFSLFFIGGAVVTFLLLKVTSWILISFLKPLRKTSRTTIRLAVLSLTKAGNQTLTILISLGLALTLFTAIALIEHNIKNRISNDIPDQAPAFFFIDIQKSQMDAFEAMITSVEGVSDLNKVPNLRGRIKLVNGQDAELALVDPSERWLLRGDRGFTYLDDKPDYSDIMEGEWWSNEYSGPPIISIVEDVAAAFDIGVGDELTLNILGRDITATVANVRTVDWSTMTINFAISFAPGALEGAPHSYLATIVAPEEIENQILNQVAQNFPNVTAIQVREALEVVTNVLEQIALAMRVIASLALITGILVLFSSILSSFRQRRYETVLLKVLGVTPKIISQSIRMEFLILGITAGVLALILGTLAAYLVVSFIMDFPWVWNFSISIMIIVSSLCITFLFSFWALSKILQTKPNDFLRNE